MPRQRQYLNVPYEERQEAKNLGAIWDAKEKKFFAPFYLEQDLFKKWSIENQKKQNVYQKIDTNEALAQFKTALETQGFLIDTPIMNGKIQRCKIIGDRGNEKSGAYVGFLDEYPAGFIQNHKTGFKENWKFTLERNEKTFKNNHSLNIKHSFQTKQEQKELERLNIQKKTALKLEKEWIESKDATKEHKYLISKGLNTAYDLKVDRFNNLLIPLRDENNKLWSLQRISENGNKIIGVIKTQEEKEQGIEYSARKKGCFYTQIPLEKQDEFLICEGFATAMTIQLATQKPTIVAIDAGNLINVAQALNQKFPKTKITIFADNDLKQELQNKRNVGLESAKAVKDLIKEVSIIIPNIDIEEAKRGMSDFNDLYQAYGIQRIKEQIFNDLKKTQEHKNNKADLEI
ncbi:DUF5710 domain-containing protein [Campylobacter cuniculorum]|uniref:Toprim domain-containing protein n=2 Tax=Campylobacter cuniculorum TaxID=374106 RepID=A0A1W6BVH0_9BACT|nr:DUF5710 domain-containing protein [Campylobacter cuniculorum]ARJ56099.1 hypothetical protein (TOPRIM domain) [Campylobacter cuniculorum DSM 23162 = LMG 24588]QOR03590.1 toprim domain-containing protein [Campylobacter cuniculorum]